MGRGSAHVELLDRRGVLRPARHRPQEEQLFERQLALEDVAFRQPEVPLDVERRQHLAMEDQVADVRRVLGNGVDHRVAERLALQVPLGRDCDRPAVVPAPAPVSLPSRRKSYGAYCTKHDITCLPGRRQRRVGQRRNHDVDVRPPREPPVLRIVVGAFHVVHAGRDGDGAAQVRPGARQAGEVRQAVEREVHLARRAAELVAAHALQEVGWQILRVEPALEREPRIDARDHRVGVELVAVLEHDAGGPAVLRENLRDRALGANLRAEAAGRVADGVRDRAGAAARQAPRAERAVDLAHVVVQQHVGRTRRSHAEERADDARRAHRGLQHVGLEPLIEEVHRAHRQQLHLVDAVVRRASRGSACPCRRSSSSPRGSSLRRVRRRHREDGLGEAAHLHHRAPVLVVGLGVQPRVAGDLAPRLLVVVHAPQVVAARHRREGAVQRQQLHAMPGQIEVADDLGPEQRHHVGADRELETRGTPLR